jgi:NAD(P)-dependent dehydrogenase (short-subunit alcohol dehydrogenase family)
VVPAMKEQGEGRIVMVNSMSAVRIEPRFGAYAASKAALGAATKTLAVELGQFGIRVNAIHPGYIWSDKQKMWFEYLAQRNGITYEEQFEAIAGSAALRYLPDSSEIAGAVIFFASDLARPITGQALHVNAGHWLGGF